MQVQIKKEICKIFETLLEWREDLLIDNVINFFKTNYYKENAEIRDERFFRKMQAKIKKKIFSELLKCPGSNVFE